MSISLPTRDAPRLDWAAPPPPALALDGVTKSFPTRAGAVAALRSLDRFWTYALTPGSVARGVEEGLTAEEAAETVERVVEGRVPPNVREAVLAWGTTAWWVDANGSGPWLRAETRLLAALRAREGVDEVFHSVDGMLQPRVPRAEAERWLEERGVRVSGEDRDPPGELGRSTRGEYARALDAWKRRLDQSGAGTPQGSYWADVVPVEPFDAKK